MLAEQNVSAILVRSHLCIIPVKSESNWPKDLRFKANYLCFPIFSSGDHFVHRRGTVLAILVEGRLRNIPKKFE